MKAMGILKEGVKMFLILQEKKTHFQRKKTIFEFLVFSLQKKKKKTI